MPAISRNVRCTEDPNQQGGPVFDVECDMDDICPGWRNVLLIGTRVPDMAEVDFDCIPCENEVGLSFVNSHNNKGIAICIPSTVRDAFTTENMMFVGISAFICIAYGIYRTIKQATKYQKETE